MNGHEIGNRLSETLGERFVTQQERSDGILFRGPDPEHRGRFLRLLITFEAWGNHEDELPGAVDRAIELLIEHGGDVVIRRDESISGLVVLQESIEDA